MFYQFTTSRLAPAVNFYSNAEPEEGKDDNSVFGEVVPAGNEDKMDDKDDDKTKTQGKSNLKILPSRKKKTVTWKEDGDLVDVCFFELDENERGRLCLAFLFFLLSYLIFSFTSCHLYSIVSQFFGHV